MALTLCVLLWARPGAHDVLADYEDRVLGLLPEHGGQVLHRARAVDAPDATGADGSSGSDDVPFEIHLLQLPSEAALDAYLADPRRLALGHQRDRAVARTRIVRVEPV